MNGRKRPPADSEIRNVVPRKEEGRVPGLRNAPERHLIGDSPAEPRGLRTAEDVDVA